MRFDLSPERWLRTVPRWCRAVGTCGLETGADASPLCLLLAAQAGKPPACWGCGPSPLCWTQAEGLRGTSTGLCPAGCLQRYFPAPFVLGGYPGAHPQLPYISMYLESSRKLYSPILLIRFSIYFHSVHYFFLKDTFCISVHVVYQHTHWNCLEPAENITWLFLLLFKSLHVFVKVHPPQNTCKKYSVPFLLPRNCLLCPGY